jgi:hypothetical protein
MTRLKKIHVRRQVRRHKHWELHRLVDAAVARNAKRRSELRSRV